MLPQYLTVCSTAATVERLCKELLPFLSTELGIQYDAQTDVYEADYERAQSHGWDCCHDRNRIDIRKSFTDTYGGTFSLTIYTQSFQDRGGRYNVVTMKNLNALVEAGLCEDTTALIAQLDDMYYVQASDVYIFHKDKLTEPSFIACFSEAMAVGCTLPTWENDTLVAVETPADAEWTPFTKTSTTTLIGHSNHSESLVWSAIPEFGDDICAVSYNYKLHAQSLSLPYDELATHCVTVYPHNA